MATWRRAGLLMGIPEAMLLQDEPDALEIFRVGLMCEPPVQDESIAMAHALINSAPLIIGITDPEDRRATARYVYAVSRALIGKELADRLRFPPQRSFGVIASFRARERYRRLVSRGLPPLGRRDGFDRFVELMNASTLEEADISYRLPDHVHTEESSRW